MKNTKLNIRKLGRQGFSLIEMLVVIAVIGVIAAIAIPNIGNINAQARESVAQRNAQNVASVSSSAVAAGAVPTATDKATGITEIGAGTLSPTSGTFKGKIFTVPNLPANDAADAADAYDLMLPHLEFNASTKILEYKQ